MVAQAIVLVAIFSVVRKTVRSMQDDVAELRASVVPVIDNVRELLVHTAPRIESAAIDLAAMTHDLRTQTADVQSAATEILERLRRQTARVDSVVTGVFDAVDHATSFMSDVVSVPMRQLAGLLASAKAVVETLRAGSSEPHIPGNHPRGDKDMFV
jgi:methyl-accepting chemotaxis protein